MGRTLFSTISGGCDFPNQYRDGSRPFAKDNRCASELLRLGSPMRASRSRTVTALTPHAAAIWPHDIPDRYMAITASFGGNFLGGMTRSARYARLDGLRFQCRELHPGIAEQLANCHAAVLRRARYTGQYASNALAAGPALAAQPTPFRHTLQVRLRHRPFVGNSCNSLVCSHTLHVRMPSTVAVTTRTTRGRRTRSRSRVHVRHRRDVGRAGLE